MGLGLELGLRLGLGLGWISPITTTIQLTSYTIIFFAIVTVVRVLFSIRS